MKHVAPIAIFAAALVIGATANAFAQNVTPRIAQQAYGPLAQAPMQPAPAAPALSQAETPQAQPRAPVVPPPTTKLPGSTFEQLVGDEVVRRNRNNPYALGAGAIAGVVLFNLASGYLAPATMMAGGPLMGTAIAETSIAASRIYAVTSAVLGAWTVNWLMQDMAD